MTVVPVLGLVLTVLVAPAATLNLDVTARSVAHNVLVRCARDGAFADRALSSALNSAQLSPRDARLATEITYGVLRNTRSLDFAIKQLVAQPNRTSVEDLAALRMGTFELVHLRTPEYAAVSQAVETAPSKASRGFLNGVLRNMARKHASLRQPEDEAAGLSATQALGVRCSLPDWVGAAPLEPSGEGGASWPLLSSGRVRRSCSRSSAPRCCPRPTPSRRGRTPTSARRGWRCA